MGLYSYVRREAERRVEKADGVFAKEVIMKTIKGV